MHQKLLILGASARAAAQSAKRAGLAPLAIDCFADQDLKEICAAVAIESYPEDFLNAAIRLEPIDWLYTGGLENYPSLVEQISARHRLLGNGREVLEPLRNPERLHATLRAAGICSPDVQLGGNPLEADPNAIWLRKPFRSGGGMGVRFFRKDDQSVLRPAAATYFQRYVDGTSVGAVFVAAMGKSHLLGASRQLIGCEWTGLQTTATNAFRYCGSVGPLRLSETVTNEFVGIADHLVREFGLMGLFGIDAILADERVWTVEVNPRYTASVELLERAAGFQAIAAHVAACRGEMVVPIEPLPLGQKQFGKAIVYAPHKLEIGSSFSEFVQSHNVNHPWPIIADVPRDGTKILRGDPMVTVFAEGSTEAAVVHSLQTLASSILSFFEKELPSL